jgi:hypothetical protein
MGDAAVELLIVDPAAEWRTGLLASLVHKRPRDPAPWAAAR